MKGLGLSAFQCHSINESDHSYFIHMIQEEDLLFLMPTKPYQDITEQQILSLDR